MCRRDAHSRSTHQQTEKPRKTRSKALSVPRRNRTFQGGVWEISDFSVPGLIVQTWAWLERGLGEKTLEALAEFLWARPCTRICAGDEDFSEWVGVKEEPVGHRQEKVASWSNTLHLAKGREKGAVKRRVNGVWLHGSCKKPNFQQWGCEESAWRCGNIWPEITTLCPIPAPHLLLASWGERQREREWEGERDLEGKEVCLPYSLAPIFSWNRSEQFSNSGLYDLLLGTSPQLPLCLLALYAKMETEQQVGGNTKHQNPGEWGLSILAPDLVPEWQISQAGMPHIVGFWLWNQGRVFCLGSSAIFSTSITFQWVGHHRIWELEETLGVISTLPLSAGISSR